MGFSFCYWCSWTKWGSCINIRLYIFVFGINQRSVCRWLSGCFLFCSFWMVVAFCSVLFEWWLVFVLLEVDTTLCDGCGIWKYLRSFWIMNLARVFLILCGCVYKMLRLMMVIVEFSIVVVSADYYSWVTQFVSHESPFFDSPFTRFVLRTSGNVKFMMLFQDSDTGGWSSIITRI